MPSDNYKSYLHLHLIVFIWGFTAILGALITLDALPLVWFRMSLASAMIGVFLLYKKIPFLLSPLVIARFLAAGCIIALHWFTFFKAIKVSNISVTLACLSSGAFFTSFLEPFLQKKKIKGIEVLFGLLAIVGLVIIFEVEMQYKLGITLALVSAFLSALFAVINSKFVQKYDAPVIAFYELVGGVCFFSILLWISGAYSPNFFKISGSDWLYLGILSSICTAYALINSVKIMQFLSPFTVMLTINLEPIYGIILALLIFNDKEKMSPAFYLGAGIILATVLLNALVKKKVR
ncbi:MAG: DMT family transporter [Flavobacterium sp.]|nr:DMT family transporter [Flavobacterium sp.]